MRVDVLTPDREEEYFSLANSLSGSMLYGSRKFRDFLVRTLPDAYPMYFMALDPQIVGCLPTFVLNTSRYGKVMNALPFYGSHGAPVVDGRDGRAREIKTCLINRMLEVADDLDVTSTTLVTSPLDADHEFYKSLDSVTHQDERIGQVSFLPCAEVGGYGEAIMAGCHQKTRNAVRKGLKSGFSFHECNDISGLQKLHRLHKEGMEAISANPKPFRVFEAIRETMNYGGDYRVSLAEREGATAAALLLLYFRDQVEYFTPAIDPNFRTDQPLAALIFKAMEQAARDGYKTWNWGGTWHSQSSVYFFKSRWGAEDIPYHYYTWLRDRQILHLDPSEILDRYPNFYVVPFDALDKPDA